MRLAAPFKRRSLASSMSAPLPIRAIPPRTSAQRKAGCSCGGGCPSCQAQQIAGPDHPAEREADSVAAQVMAMAEPSAGAVSSPPQDAVMRQSESADEITGSLQRETEEEEEVLQAQTEESEEEVVQADMGGSEEEGEEIQARAEPGGAQGAQARPMAGLGGGQALPAQLRNFFEPRFGRSFADVRIHQGDAAGRRARDINARAFTYGRNIVFAPGRYSPDTAAGRHLLAHELTHVVQQRQDRGRESIMRVEAEDCGTKESDLLVRHFTARRILKKAIAMTAERDPRGNRTPAVKAALLKWFKIDMDGSQHFQNGRRLGHVEKAMKTTFDGSNEVSYECGEHGLFEACKPGRNAVTAGNIHICPDWWTEPEDRQAIILIHEWGHKYGVGINRLLETYCWEDDWKSLPSDERIQMPDAYEGFISELALGAGTC